MGSIVFIHAADLHLDSPFQSVQGLDDTWMARLRESSWQALDKLISTAIERQVDFVILSGDVFDHDGYSIKAYMRFYKQLQRLSQKSIHTYILHGNHDPKHGDAQHVFAGNDPHIHVFSADRVEMISHYKDGQEVVRLYGRSFWQRHVYEDLATQYIMYERQERVDSPMMHSVKKIGVLHAVIGKEAEHMPYAPTSMEQLCDSSFDYWAMGHVHTRNVLRSDEPLVVYPGNTQGRNIRETGDRGCYIVTWKDCHTGGRQAVDLQFCPLAQVRWEQVEVDVSDLESDRLEQVGFPILLDFLREQLEGHYRRLGKPLVVRLILQGQTPLYQELRKPDTREVVREELATQVIAIIEVVNHTRPVIDVERLRKQKTLLGEFLIFLQQARQQPELLQEIREQLQPLYGNRQFQQHTHTKAGQIGKSLWLPSENDPMLLEWLDEVEQLGIDLLLEGEMF